MICYEKYPGNKMNVQKIFGAHTVRAAVEYAPQDISKVYLQQGERYRELQELLGKNGIIHQICSRQHLDKMASGENHQGIIAYVKLPTMHGEKQLQDFVCQATKPPFWLILDCVQDPHNLGACLRSADAVGACGVIVPKNNAVGITPTVCKVASGAASTVRVCAVSNLARTCRWLKQQGIWLVGTSASASLSLFAADLTVPLALIVGAEDVGMRRLTEQQCDFVVKIPLLGKVASLNAAVATGVLLYQVIQQRGDDG